MKLLYFAWVRQKVGKGTETVDLPDEVATVSDLVTWLKGRVKLLKNAAEGKFSPQ